jgi:DNA-binding transcriptional regulator YiaG
MPRSERDAPVRKPEATDSSERNRDRAMRRCEPSLSGGGTHRLMFSDQSPNRAVSGSDLARVRTNARLSGRQVAARMRVSRQRVSAIEASARVAPAALDRVLTAISELIAERDGRA